MAVPSHENRPRPRFRSSVTDRLLPGVRRVLLIPPPAAGFEWGPVGPGGGRVWRLLGGFTFLQTSAAVANRTPGINISDGNENVIRSYAPGVVAAGVSQRVGYWPASSAPGAGGSPLIDNVPVPELLIPGGWTIASQTDLIQAADSYTTVALVIEEIYESWQDVTLHHLAEEEEALAAAGLLSSATAPRG